MANDAVMNNLVRIGTVQAVRDVQPRVRVWFDALGMSSGWLYVLQHNGADVVVSADNEHTHDISDSYTGGGNASTVPAHKHPGTKLATWVPKVNDRVLVLYLPVANGDGFILGGL